MRLSFPTPEVGMLKEGVSKRETHTRNQELQTEVLQNPWPAQTLVAAA